MAAFIVLLWLLSEALLPFILGAAIAYLTDPLADWLERRGLGRVLATVRLPVAGLMSAEPVETVAAEVRAFNALARELGLGGSSPVLAISSLALPVAPFFRITDLGLVDTLRQEFVEM